MKLTKEELNKLILIAQGGDLDAKVHIIQSHQAFVSNMVKKAGFLPDNINYDDLMAAGTIGLIKAIDSIDLSRSSFSTWAFWHVRKAIQSERLRCFPVRIRPADLYEGCRLCTSIAEGEHDNSYVDMHSDDNFKFWYAIVLDYLREQYTEKEIEIFLKYYVDQATARELQIKYNANIKSIVQKMKLRLRHRFDYKKSEIFD